MTNIKTTSEVNMNNVPRYMTEQKVAEITGLSVYKLRQDRFKCCGLPYIKIGRAVRYSLGDLIGYMEARRIKPSNR